MSGNPPAAVERFVREHRVARLGTVDEGGHPHVVPICYAYTRGRLYTSLDLKPKAVAPEGLRRVRNILANPQVQVLIDDYDEDWSRWRSSSSGARRPFCTKASSTAGRCAC